MKKKINEINIFIICSTFYSNLSDELVKGATEKFIGRGGNIKNLNIIKVPGTFEVPGTVNIVLQNKKPDLIITLGVVIKGETTHFEYICSSIAQSLSELTINHNIPIIFGILTTYNKEQAIERSSVTRGNKGGEAMKTGLSMIDVYDHLKN